MEERAPETPQGTTPPSLPRQTNWRDLREWLSLVSIRHG